MTEPNEFFVLTGGPGSGKTTLLTALAENGVQVMPEAGRAVIRDQIEVGGAALPWKDQRAFADAMLCWDLRSYREARSGAGVVLFDRGLPDLCGYLSISGIPVPPHIKKASEIFRYNTQVFIAPPWPEIFSRDTERRQTLDEAHKTYDAMVKSYLELGYDLIQLPKTPVPDRARFVLDRIAFLT